MYCKIIGTKIPHKNWKCLVSEVRVGISPSMHVYVVSVGRRRFPEHYNFLSTARGSGVTTSQTLLNKTQGTLNNAITYAFLLAWLRYEKYQRTKW